jgi:hypothetical protein
MKKVEMGGMHNMHGKTKKMHIKRQSENFKGRCYIGDQGIDGRIILKWNWGT